MRHSGAGSRLTDVILDSTSARIAFLGLAKNVGKTTALVSVLAELARRGIVAGATSAGRDGEGFDAITGEPKPRFAFWSGSLVASAASTFRSVGNFSLPLAILPDPTRLGPIEIRRCESSGDIEVIGPSTASRVLEACGALEAAGAKIVLIDGAIGRRAFASCRVADGIVLSAGLVAGESLSTAIESARLAAELIRLPALSPDANSRAISGALTDASLVEISPNPGETIVADDFASIFLSVESRRGLADLGIALAVRNPARLLAATANPTAPARRPVEARAFFEALVRALPDVPVFDVVADLSSVPTL